MQEFFIFHFFGFCQKLCLEGPECEKLLGILGIY